MISVEEFGFGRESSLNEGFQRKVYPKEQRKATNREPKGSDQPDLPKNGDIKSKSCHKLKVSQTLESATFLHQTTEKKLRT